MWLYLNWVKRSCNTVYWITHYNWFEKQVSINQLWFLECNITDMSHLIKKIVNSLEMSSLKKLKGNMKYTECPLNSKLIQDVWRLTKKKSNHWLMETDLSEKNTSRVIVYLVDQLLSSSVVTMLRKATNDSSIHPNVDLKQNQYEKIIEMAEKVDKLVDICNGRSKEKRKYTAYFNPENGHKIQIELLDILDWFTLNEMIL